MTVLQPPSGQLSVLTLEVLAGRNPDWPQARILINGVDLFEAVAPAWLGFDPDDILGGATSPLLPHEEGRRVAVLRCSCGEAGCGVIAPIIRLSDDERHVLWQDYKEFTGVFVRPATRYPQVELIPSRRWNVPDLRFDREEYAAAIVMASKDRSWEAPRRQIARLLYEQLSLVDLVLPPDLPLQAAFPESEGDGFIVRFGLESDDGTVRFEDLRLASAVQDHAAAARDMASQLRSTSPEQWLRTFGAS